MDIMNNINGIIQMILYRASLPGPDKLPLYSYFTGKLWTFYFTEGARNKVKLSIFRNGNYIIIVSSFGIQTKKIEDFLTR